jgi:hypothetical protein
MEKSHKVEALMIHQQISNHAKFFVVTMIFMNLLLSLTDFIPKTL